MSNINTVARFEKVSYEQFRSSLCAVQNENFIKRSYEEYVKLPQRATVGSAGYDFTCPVKCILKPGESVKFPSGIRAVIDEGWYLAIYPRSGLGFKYRIQLDNTVGIIDSDYSNSDNEGHIFFKITNDSKNGDVVKIEAGDRFAQGIFMPFGITYNDEVSGQRNGGFGSTGT